MKGREGREGREGKGGEGGLTWCICGFPLTLACLLALVLRRVKVTFIDTVLRIEHVPENSKTGAALEIRVDR